ncbi:MAG: aldo/keto reductase [Promethearchaeota archaeon]|nr:MAG: aldo/keto reductase [Candidatus Lokiarchaeota archaeon]
MNYRILGKTNLKVSEIGIGTEYLFDENKEVVKAVINEAIEQGINYFDILFSVEHYLKKIAPSIKNIRDQIIITGHIGTTELNERPKRNRNIKECKDAFLRLLDNLQTSYVDIINVQFVKEKEFDQLLKPNGLVDLGRDFIEEGKAKFLGLSTHDAIVAKRAIETGKFDMIMFPFNLVNHNLPGRGEILNLCKENNIGLVTIKPFSAGRILQQNRTVSIAKYQTGGISMKIKNPVDISASICLNYIRQYPEISVILMGLKNQAELKSNLTYSKVNSDEINFTPFIDAYHK